MKHLVALLVLIVAGCSTTPSTTFSRTEIFTDYRVMSIPRANARVGAQWQQGLGPNGPGLTSSDITTSDSYSTVSTTSGFGAQVAANIYSLLNTSATAQQQSTMTLHDVQTVTISNIATLNLQPGSDIIYEGVKVGSISIKTSDSLGAGIETAAIEKFGNSVVSAVAGGAGNTTVSAKDVYVAYRVISLGEAKPTVDVQNFDGGKTVSVGGYSITVRTALLACMCPRDREGRMVIGDGPTPSLRAKCEHEKPLFVEVENPTLDLVGSGGISKTYEYFMHHHDQAPVMLESRQKSGKFEVDKMTIAATVKSDILRACFAVGPGSFDKDSSTIRIESTVYPFRVLAKPIAAGW